MLLVFVASLVGSFGAVFLKLGSTHLDGTITSFLNRDLALGVGLSLGSSVFYALGIRHGQLSVLYPMVSLGYIPAASPLTQIPFGWEISDTGGKPVTFSMSSFDVNLQN